MVASKHCRCCAEPSSNRQTSKCFELLPVTQKLYALRVCAGPCSHELVGTLRTARAWVCSDVFISFRNAWLSMILDTFDANTWCGTRMPGGAPYPYMVGSPHTAPWAPPKLACCHVCGFPTVYGFGFPPCIWVPQYVFASKVSSISYQVLRVRHQASGIQACRHPSIRISRYQISRIIR